MLRRRCWFGLTLVLLITLLVPILPIPRLDAYAMQSFTPPDPTPTPEPPAPEERSLPSENYPALPGLHLDLVATPDPASIGDTLTLTLTLTNRATNPANDLIVTLPVPTGATVPTNAAQTEWRWQLDMLPGGAQHTLTTTLQLITMPPGGALLAHPQVTAQGLDQPVQAIGGVLVSSDSTANTSELGTTLFSPGTPAELYSRDGQVQVTVPADAFSRELRLNHVSPTEKLAEKGESGTVLPPEQAGFRRGLGTFLLEAYDLAGEEIHKFAAPLTITVRYTPQQLQARGLTEHSLQFFWFDPDARMTRSDGTLQHGQWVPMPTQVDPATHTAQMTVDHFSAFQLSDGSSPSAAYIPSLQNWQLGLFTGAANFSYPIDVPAGPGGLKPALELSYSSAASDGTGGARDKWQAGWVGKGWSFDPGGSVSLNRSPAGERWNNFSFVFAGRSFNVVKGQLLPGYTDYYDTDITHWSWHPVDDSFVRVQALSGTAWRVWLKDGTRYDFAQPLWWGWTEPDSREVYQWLLTQVTDTSGNVIRYDYAVDTVGAAPDTYNPTYYLRAITWGYDGVGGTGTPRYRVEFTVASRWASPTEQVDTAWESGSNQAGNTSGTPHQAYRLDRITVQSMPPLSAGYKTVRRYELRYYASSESVQTDSWQGQKVLTLKEIWRTDRDGVVTLPPMSFSYGMNRGSDQAPIPGWNRLLSANNGQGGAVNFTYEHVWLPDQIPPGDPYFLYENYYRVTALRQRDISGQSYSQSALKIYSYTAPALNDYLHAATVVYAQYPPTGNGDSRSYLANPEKREFRGHASVIERSYDGDTSSAPLLQEVQHWFYQGDAGCSPQISDGKLVETDSCFQEMQRREALKGRSYQTDQRSPNGTLLQRSIQHFTRYPLPFFGSDAAVPNATAMSNNYARAGLWRVFTPNTQTEQQAFEGQSTPRSHTTTNTYDIVWNTNSNGRVYGNLSQIAEADTSGTPVRIIQRSYAINDLSPTNSSATTYIADRVWLEAVRSSDDQVLALRQWFYDGYDQSPGVVGTRGLYTRSHDYFDIPAQQNPPPSNLQGITLHGRDTSYGYDAYGNQTSVSSYSVAGTRLYTGSDWVISALDPQQARTTTTSYDSVFHVFPTQVTNPLGHTERAGYDYRMGTLTSVSDANGNTTTAMYDGFGRLIQIVKPGDSPLAPTVAAVYYDWEQPFHYLVKQRTSAGGDVRPVQQFYDGLGRLIRSKAESLDGTQNIVSDTRYDGLGRVAQRGQPWYSNETPGGNFYRYATTNSTTQWTTTRYDGLGRVVATILPDGSTTNTSYRLGTMGIVISVIDAKGHQIAREQDMLGRLRAVYEYRGNNGNEGGYLLDATTTYSYSPLDLLTRVVDAVGNTTSISYDSLGRKLTMRDPDMGTWAYAYDANGNLSSQTDARGQRISFSYDALDRLTSKRYGSTNIFYVYDEGASIRQNGIGQRTSMGVQVNGALQSYQYWHRDGRGRISFTGHWLAALNNWRTFGWSYNSADNIASITYPSVGGTSETLSYSYDGAQRSTWACWTNYTCYLGWAKYTAQNQPAEWTFGNGLVQTWSYTTPNLDLTRIQVGSSAGTGNRLDRSYSYDAVGNISRISDANGGPTQSFAYDQRDRLSQWTLGNTVEQYTYDTIGNLTHKAGVNYSYPAPGAERPHALSSAGLSAPYTYDANGNLLNDPGRSYHWDAENRPLSISANGTTETYTYSADGARLTRTANGQTTLFLEGLWEETIGVNTKKYYPFNGQTVAMWDSTAASAGGNGIVLLHRDHLGSVGLATDMAQGSQGAQEFDPWGARRSGGISWTAQNYTGQYLDGTGLLYYNARYYDPTIGRFISADTVVPGTATGRMDGVAIKPLTTGFHETPFLTKLNGENQRGFWFELSDQERQQVGSPWGPSNPQSLNRYAYVQNNPLKYTDPTGHYVSLNKSQALMMLQILDEAMSSLDSTVSAVEALSAALIAALTAAVGATTAAVAVLGAELAAGASSFFGDLINMLKLDPAGAYATRDMLEFMRRQLDYFVRPGHDATTIEFWVGATTDGYAMFSYWDFPAPNGDRVRSHSIPKWMHDKLAADWGNAFFPGRIEQAKYPCPA